MDQPPPPVISRMLALIDQWQAAADERWFFLSCYQMMTSNMLEAIDAQDFHDPPWVNRLLHLFADYYFRALEAYERQPESAPAIWVLAFKTTEDPEVMAIEKLLLGVNAHINYDLVLTLVELLDHEWAGLSEQQRQERYADHCHINDVIGETIDAVQDNILERAQPIMDLVDKLMGGVDELIISRLISRWRESVWQQAVCMLESQNIPERQEQLARLDASAHWQAKAIQRKDWRAVLDMMF